MEPDKYSTNPESKHYLCFRNGIMGMVKEMLLPPLENMKRSG
jgi:hypothetical protein